MNADNATELPAEASPPGPSGLIVLCTYRVRAGSETEFEALLDRHAPMLRGLGLITEFPTQALRQVDDGDSNEPLYVEVLEWASPEAAARASEVPEVIAVWEPMAALCESRGGLPGLEFPTFDRVRAPQ